MPFVPSRGLLISLILAGAIGCGGSSSGPGEVDAGVLCDLDRYTTTSLIALDMTTGLTWQRQEAPNKLTWEDAIAYCAALTLEGGGWHLATVTELQSIVVLGKAPTVDICAFPNTSASWFWTSSMLPGDALNAQAVYFGVGNTGSDSKAYTNRVRCVR